MSWKRPLYLFHRWAGIVLCLFFALWFISGIFMMYVGYPELTRPERIAGSMDLDFSRAIITPAQSIEQLRPNDFDTIATPSSLRPAEVIESVSSAFIRSVRLAMISDRPAYIVHASNGAQPRVVFADSGEVLQRTTPDMGRVVAERFAKRSGWDVSRLEYERTVHTDQWTLSSGLNDHRPLLKYALNDDAGTTLYVSTRTAEVVRDAQRTERILNWFGAVTHWIYFTAIRKYPVLWEWVVDILSAAGTLLAISGLWIGVLRWKRNPKPGKPTVPYRGLMRWHYFTGITFGVVTITWVFSGLLSMNPLNLNPSRRPTSEQQEVYTGKALTPADFASVPMPMGAGVFEADLLHFAGQPFYRLWGQDLSTRLVGAGGVAPQLPNAQQMMDRAHLLLPGHPVRERVVLTSYDNYYYTRHPERGDKSLPIVRIIFDDPDKTWFHLDPQTGQVVERSTFTNRVYRWLYNGLHSWDILWLWERRPLWDICVIGFLLGGTLLSLLGVVIGIRRLRYKYGRTPASLQQPAQLDSTLALESR